MGRIRINQPVRKPLVRFANGTKYCEPVSLVRELEGSLMGRNIYTSVGREIQDLGKVFASS
jgi:hypothetical protein